MEGPLEQPDAKRSYLEFFGLTQPPFANLAKPSQIFHTDQNHLLMAHLANATEQSDYLVVISGAEGSGKTALLNRYISELDDQVSFAVIGDTCAGEGEFYGTFLSQIGFGEITGTPEELRHITKQFLVSRGVAGDPVLIVIDNAERIKPVVFDQLRRIADITVDSRRVLSIVLVGNSQLVHLVNSPAMSKIDFQNHIHFNVRRFTEDETSKYIWQRLWWAGGVDNVKFVDEAFPLIFRYTAGIARQINMLCNDALFEACTLKSRIISASLIRKVAKKRNIPPRIVPLHGKGRRKTDHDFVQAQRELQADQVEASPHSEAQSKVEKAVAKPSAHAAGTEELREQISSLREQVSDLTADKLRALNDISMRDQDISELRNRLQEQTIETQKLGRALKINSDEIRRQNQALAVSLKASQESEEVTKKLAADLERERVATIKAQADIKKAEAKTAELGQLRQELQNQTSRTEQLAKALLDNANEMERQNQALTDSRNALQESQAATAELAADLEQERESARASEAEIVKARAKAEELGELRDKLDSQSAEIERLTNALERNSYEFRQQNQELADSTHALQQSEEAARKLAADLERERIAAKTAQADIAKAEARAEELEQLREKLDAQTAKTAELTRALKNNADEIGWQNRALADSVNALRESEEATKKLATELEKERVAAQIARTEITRAKEKAEELSHQKTELQAAIGNVTANLEKSEGRRIGADALVIKLIENVPACQTLRKFDQATYNSLIATCELMVKQNYSEQQIADALRVQQAELIERRVPKSSDKALINYARLIVDQLREFKIHGADLCFGLWVPQISGGHDASPGISEKTRDREYALLELALRTYDADKEIPTDEVVWPDIWPIFLNLFEAYGEANVSAHFDASAPNADKEIKCNISMSLYQKILKLRNKSAANVLRWILSP